MMEVTINIKPLEPIEEVICDFISFNFSGKTKKITLWKNHEKVKILYDKEIEKIICIKEI